jgi:preprotein translocase subunit SecY
MFPATIANFIPHPALKTVSLWLSPGHWLHTICYIGFIVFFCFFYTAIVFNTQDVAENMKKYGGFIPGIRPGKATAEYIDKVLSRITFGGAIYISAVCILPEILITKFNVPFYFGGTALLIVVGVALDTVAQIEAHMLTRHYEGFLKQGRVVGRR